MSNLAANSPDPPDDTPIPPRSMKTTPKYSRDTDRPYVGDPWDVQPKEPARAFEAFTIYLKLEGRTIEETKRIFCARHDLKSANIRVWSKKHRWEERAEAFDSFMMAKEIRALSKRRVAAAKRHADQAEAAQEVVMLPIAELRKRIMEQGGKLGAVSKLEDADLIRLFKAMGGGSELAGLQKAERDAIGSVSESSGQDTKVIAERGAILKRVLGNPELVAMFERVTIEGSVAETVEGEAVEG